MKIKSVNAYDLTRLLAFVFPINHIIGVSLIDNRWHILKRHIRDTVWADLHASA